MLIQSHFSLLQTNKTYIHFNDLKWVFHMSSFTKFQRLGMKWLFITLYQF